MSFSRSAAGAASAEPGRGQRASRSSSKRTDTGVPVRAHVRIDTRPMRVVGSGKAADVLGAHALAPNPSVGVAALGVRVHRAFASCGSVGSRRSGWSRGAGDRIPIVNVRGRSRVGKATPVRKGAGGQCRGACEGAELVRVRYERHSLLFGRSWRELTPLPLFPSERARTR